MIIYSKKRTKDKVDSWMKHGNEQAVSCSFIIIGNGLPVRLDQRTGQLLDQSVDRYLTVLKRKQNIKETIGERARLFLIVAKRGEVSA